jgi:cysteine desulfurase
VPLDGLDDAPHPLGRGIDVGRDADPSHGSRRYIRRVDGVAYLDHAATTPMRHEAVEAMRPYMDVLYANPSGSHRFARAARRAIDEARDDVAAVLGCAPGEVVFTSGGTEGDNTAVLGAVRRSGGTAVCSAAEHHAVLHCVEHAKGRVVGVDAAGEIDADALRDALREVARTGHASVVSVMAVNNEVGTITDMARVARVVREEAPGAVLHTDAVQAACWLDLRAISPLVDVMSLSAHKFGGPKGVGITMIRSGAPVEPLILGGGQERDRRSGTHNVGGIVAAAAALRATDAERATEVARVGALTERLVAAATGGAEGVCATVPRERRVPSIAHLCARGLESEALLYLLDEAGVCASAASACASGAMEPSHVLAAMGVGREWAAGSLRFSLGHTTTADDVDRATGALVGAVRRLRGAA